MSHRTKQFLLTGTLTLGSLVEALAQSTSVAPAPDGLAAGSAPQAQMQSAEKVQSVEIKGEQYDARRDDTATKIVVSQAEIVQYGDSTLADVLKRQPGITINGGAAGRGGGEIRMRGLGAGYTQVLLNGQPVPPGFTLDSLPPSQVERIEILRAATAEFSTQSIAGTINIVLKSKVVAGQRDFKVTGERSSILRSGSADFNLADKGPSFSYLLTGAFRVSTLNQDSEQTDEQFDSKGATIGLRRAKKFTEGRQTNLSLTPRFLWNLSGGDILSSQTFLTSERTHGTLSTAWSTAAGAPPPYLTEFLRLDNASDMLRSDIGWISKTATGGKMETKLTVNASRRDSNVRQYGYAADRRETLDRNNDDNARERGATLVGKYASPVREGHALVFGWDGGTTHRDQDYAVRDRAIAGIVPVDRSEQYTARLNRLALYAQDEWTITKQWSTYFGIRWETLRIDSEGTSFSRISNRTSVLSPLFQTLWKFPGNTNEQLRAALTRTYKAPSLLRLIPGTALSLDNSPTQPDPRGNPDLKPELANGLDLSYERFLGGGASLSASAYARRIRDITRNDTRLVNGRWISLPINDGNAETHGLSFDAKLPLRLVYKNGPDLDVRANLTRNWSSVDNTPGPDNRLGDQTPLSANFGLDYKMNTSFNMGGNFTYKGGGPVRISENIRTFSTIKRELDIYGLFKFTPKLQLRASAANLLRQSHTTQSRYEAATTFQTNTVVPSSAIFRLALEVKL